MKKIVNMEEIQTNETRLGENKEWESIKILIQVLN